MKLSICTITYNHASFIRQAVESFVIQQTDFEFEIVICDDCSGDGTREILKELKTAHSEKIKLFLNESNLGMIPNLMQALQVCKGKYIAICEGDDYWADPNKLQKQVDFLEANLEYSICFHRVYYKLDGIAAVVLSQLNRSEKEETYSIKDLSKENIIRTPSVVFRNGLIKELPSWFSRAAAGDYVLHMLNAKKGLIKYFPEPMAVYRIHEGGVWGQKSIEENYPKWISLLDHLIGEDFGPVVIENLMQQKRKTLKEYLGWALQNKKYHLITSAASLHYNNRNSANLDFLINDLLEYIASLDKYIEGVKSTRTYMFAKKMSDKKFKLKKFFDNKK